MANQTRIIVEGLLHSISAVQDIQTANGVYQKREIVIKSPKPNGKEDFFKIEISGDMKLQYINSFEIGQRVEAKAYVNGKRYEKEGAENFFTSLDLDSIKTI